MGSRFIKTSSRPNLNLIVVYPGVGYGTQAYVEGRINEHVLPHVDASNVLIAIEERHNTDWGELLTDIDTYARNEQINLKPGAIVGWSGGATGVAKAISAGHEFPAILLADPSPVSGAFQDARVRMWYQPSNWKGQYEALGPRQAAQAETMGDRAILMQLDHNQILDEVLKTAITKQKSGIPLPLLIAVPAVLLTTALVWRASR